MPGLENLPLSNCTTAININFSHWFGVFFPIEILNVEVLPFLDQAWTLFSKTLCPRGEQRMMNAKTCIKQNLTWAANSKTYFEGCVWVEGCQDKFCLCHILCSQLSSAELHRMYTTQFAPLASAIIQPPSVLGVICIQSIKPCASRSTESPNSSGQPFYSRL